MLSAEIGEKVAGGSAVVTNRFGIEGSAEGIDSAIENKR
jgi:hypothetical protein